MANFIMYIYTYYWFCFPVPQDAPSKTIQLWKDIHAYTAFDEDVANVGIKKLSNHTWYVMPCQVVFALFSDKITNAEKEKMRQRLNEVKQTLDMTEMTPPGKPPMPTINNNSTLTEFVDEQSFDFWKITKLPCTFLDKEAMYWDNDENFLKSSAVVKQLKIVNDNAERHVILAGDFNGWGRKNFEMWNMQLQVVEKRRKANPETTKKAKKKLLGENFE